jgi:hypothetical protein
MSGGIVGDLCARDLGVELTIADQVHGTVHWTLSGTLVEVSHHGSTADQSTVVMQLFGGSPTVRMTLSSSTGYTRM